MQAYFELQLRIFVLGIFSEKLEAHQEVATVAVVEQLLSYDTVTLKKGMDT